MNQFSDPTIIERVAGSLPVQASLTVVATLAGGPLTALLPVLATTLASSRQSKRIEKCLKDFDALLRQHTKTLHEISDAQYKIINEAILAALHTTQQEKLELLKNVVAHSIDFPAYAPQEAIVLSRIVRDISCEEAKFVVANFAYKGVLIGTEGFAQGREKILCIEPDSSEALIVGGLLSLGVLTTGIPTLGQILRFSAITAKLIVLLGGAPGD